MILKKKMIPIICLLVCAAGLGTALAALLGAPQQEPGAVDPDGALPLVYELSTPVRSIEIAAEGRKPFTLQNLAADAAEHEESPASTIPGREGFPLYTSKISSVLDGAIKLACTELLLESADDYAQFGLTAPRARVRVEGMDGESLTLLLGRNAPGGAGAYVRLEGRPEIYLVPSYSLDSYLSGEEAFFSLTVTSGESSDFDMMVLGGECRAETGEVRILASGAEGSNRLTAPVERPLELSALSGLRAIFGLQATGVAAIEPEQSDLEALGFDAPWSTARVRGGQGEFTLSVTKPDEAGTSYLRLDGTPVLYTVSADSLPWLEQSYFDLMDKAAYSADIGDLSEVRVTTPGREYRFLLTGEGSEPAVTLDGKALDTDNFRRFYQTMMLAEYEELPDVAPLNPLLGSAMPSWELSLHYSLKSGETHTVFFVKGPARRCYIYTDLGPAYLISSGYVDRVLADAEKVAGGIEVKAYGQ